MQAALRSRPTIRAFYSVTLKNFVTPWTNRDQTVFAPLNDYTATVIGMVRDNVAVQHRAVGRHPLYGQRRRTPAVSAVRTTITTPAAEDAEREPEAALPADHAERRVRHSSRRHRGSHDDARRVGAFFIAGTNRAMFRFTMVNHMCRDMEQLADTTRPPDRIRQDVSALPRW